MIYGGTLQTPSIQNSLDLPTVLKQKSALLHEVHILKNRGFGNSVNT